MTTFNGETEMSTTNDIIIHDATPSMSEVLASGKRPVEYTERKNAGFRTQEAWARQTLGFRRVAELCGIDPDTHDITVVTGEIENDDDMKRDFATLGAVCCVLLYLPASAEIEAAGGGSYCTTIGLSSDGCRAMLQRGGEWQPTADGLYPWPTMANAL